MLALAASVALQLKPDDARGWWILPPRSERRKLLLLLPLPLLPTPAAEPVNDAAVADGDGADGALRCRYDGELLRWKPLPTDPALAVGVRPPIGPKLPAWSMLQVKCTHYSA